MVVLFIQNGSNYNDIKTTSNQTKYVVLGGESIGLNISTNVKITGFYEVTTNNGKIKPWENSNISVDDEIISLNGVKISGIDSFKEVMSNIKDENNPVSIVLKRKSNDSDFVEVNTRINIIENVKNTFSVGLYVKDNVLGVGTLTYYDIGNKSFGALGHSAISTTFNKGTIYSSRVTGVIKGIRGTPGEKKAILDNEVIGVIKTNNEFGIFGSYNSFNKEYDLIPVATINEIRTGDAQIVTVISGTQKQKFNIKIDEVQYQKNEKIKGIRFHVTDEELIAKTGGIIQGMSGSPIIQNGKLIGAVSHVLVDNSEVGFGVFTQWMIEYS